MLETAKFYVNGSAAPKPEYEVYDIYEQNPVLKQKKEQKSHAKFKLKLVAYTMATFALFLAIMFRYAVITKINYDINKETKVYAKLRDENARLKVEIERMLDLREVKEIAQVRLGMQMPEDYQIIYVNVPKTDFTRITESGLKAEKKSGWIYVIKEKIASLLYLLG